jgi:hypothetical protein
MAGFCHEVINIVQHVYSQQDICNSDRKRIDKSASKVEEFDESTNENDFSIRTRQFEEDDKALFSAHHPRCAPVGSV